MGRKPNPKKEEAQDAELTPEANQGSLPEEKQPAEPAPEAKVMAPSVGRIVHFHRKVQNQTGSKLETFAALVNSLADGTSNFKPADMAVNLTVFTKHATETRFGVMFSQEPRDGFWTWPARA